ncbi:MAG: hypothetical protein KDC26_08665 [Armatimonadetes bacterium]|nr:hypothetical protein [Armatimonadota bacterium]
MADDKIFSEKEASDILIRAAKLQEELPEEGDEYIPGLTLSELKKMAKELGVDEKYVLRAIERPPAGGFSIKEKKPEENFFGTPFSREYEAVIEGELPPEHFDVIIEDLQFSNTMKQRRHTMTPVQIGRSVHAQIWGGLTRGQFQMSSRNGRTRMKMKTNPFFSFFVSMYPTFIASVVTIASLDERGVKLGAGVGIALITSVVALGFLIGTQINKWSTKALRKKFDDMVAKVDEENRELRQNLEQAENKEVQSEQTELLENRLRD